MKFGHARVSTKSQKYDLQVDAFLKEGIDTKNKEFKPDTLMKWLEGRLPQPVESLEQWNEE